MRKLRYGTSGQRAGEGEAAKLCCLYIWMNVGESDLCMCDGVFDRIKENASCKCHVTLFVGYKVLADTRPLVKVVQDVAPRGKRHDVHRIMLIVFSFKCWSLLNWRNETCRSTFITVFVRFYMSMSCLCVFAFNCVFWYSKWSLCCCYPVWSLYRLPCRAAANWCAFPR